MNRQLNIDDIYEEQNERLEEAKRKRVAAKLLESDAAQMQKLAHAADALDADMRDCFHGAKATAREEGITLTWGGKLFGALCALNKAAIEAEHEMWAAARKLRDEAERVERGDL